MLLSGSPEAEDKALHHLLCLCVSQQSRSRLAPVQTARPPTRTSTVNEKPRSGALSSACQRLQPRGLSSLHSRRRRSRADFTPSASQTPSFQVFSLWNSSILASCLLQKASLQILIQRHATLQFMWNREQQRLQEKAEEV